MRLSEAGRMVAEEWLAVPGQFQDVDLDEFIVMPDHIHGILHLSDAAGTRGLHEIVGTFKSKTTRRYALGVRESGWPPFDKHIWQRGYYDHVIRNEISLAEIREYIRTNPLRWWLRYSSGL